MDNPGIFSLGDVAITTATTYVSIWLDGFDGIQSLGVDLLFAYGSGGGSGLVYLQTSLRQAQETTDEGVDIACMSFDVATKHMLTNPSAVPSQTSLVPATDGALAPDTVIGGILGDRFRLKIVTTGPAYATSTTVSCRIAAR